MEEIKMTYLASEAAKKLKLSKDTLRYYEREGLVPVILKNKSGHRVYTETDIEWIFLIRCLRDSDMPIAKIRQYVSLLISKGGGSILERRDILSEHMTFLKEKILSFQNLLKLIEKKIMFYDMALESENPDAIRCMDYAVEWESFKGFLGGVKHG
jgi:DNA-binding transcriptional MerR regulator